MKTILVPTDFSKNAENALDYAIGMFGSEKAKLILLNTYLIMYTDTDFQGLYAHEQREYTEKNTNDSFTSLREKLKSHKNIEYETVSSEGLVVNTILETAEKYKVDLIVMGTKGASGLKAVLMGSTTSKVINRTIRTLIAVPEKANFKPVKKIVFATDFRANDLKVVQKLITIAEMYGSSITVFHVVTGVNDALYEENVMKKFKTKISKKISYQPITYKLLYSDNVEVKLEKYLKAESAGLLALSTKNKNLFQRVFGKSVLKKIALHTKIPLIVFHTKASG